MGNYNEELEVDISLNLPSPLVLPSSKSPVSRDPTEPPSPTTSPNVRQCSSAPPPFFPFSPLAPPLMPLYCVDLPLVFGLQLHLVKGIPGSQCRMVSSALRLRFRLSSTCQVSTMTPPSINFPMGFHPDCGLGPLSGSCSWLLLQSSPPWYLPRSSYLVSYTSPAISSSGAPSISPQLDLLRCGVSYF